MVMDKGWYVSQSLYGRKYGFCSSTVGISLMVWVSIPYMGTLDPLGLGGGEIPHFADGRPLTRAAAKVCIKAAFNHYCIWVRKGFRV